MLGRELLGVPLLVVRRAGLCAGRLVDSDLRGAGVCIDIERWWVCLRSDVERSGVLTDSERLGVGRVEFERLGSGLRIDAERCGVGRVLVARGSFVLVERLSAGRLAESEGRGLSERPILLPDILWVRLRTAVASRISRIPSERSFSSPAKVPRHFMIQPCTDDAGGRERLRPSAWNSCYVVCVSQ